MQLADFACENCRDRESTLNVHHGYYAQGLEPWEYDSNTLHCLCDSCHSAADELRRRLVRLCGQLSIRDQEAVERIIQFITDPNWSGGVLPERFADLAAVFGIAINDEALQIPNRPELRHQETHFRGRYVFLATNMEG